MTGDFVMQIGREALTMVLLITAPVLGLGVMVGVMVSLFQAATQIQEQTLAFVPKIVAMFAAMVIFGPWMLSMMVDYVRNILINLPQYIR